MDQEQKPRERVSKFIKDLVAPARQPSKNQVLWAIRIALVLAVLLSILTLIGLPFHVTLWNWLDLLIVPVVLAIGGYLFTSSENRSTRVAAAQRTQDEALQAYLDGMSQLINDKELPLHSAHPDDSLSTLARARTLTVLPRLDGGRKGSVLQFLFESGLIYKERSFLNERGLIERQHNIVSLKNADLSAANLDQSSSLYRADLSFTNLRKANLSYTDLAEANLSWTNLEEANLFSAFLMEANLEFANLSGADLRKGGLNSANLSAANLSGADLSENSLNSAILNSADLSGADLSWTDLSETRGWTQEQLASAKSLEGATMPDGQILKNDDYPDWPTFKDWLKDRESRGEAQ